MRDPAPKPVPVPSTQPETENEQEMTMEEYMKLPAEERKGAQVLNMTFRGEEIWRPGQPGLSREELMRKVLGKK